MLPFFPAFTPRLPHPQPEGDQRDREHRLLVKEELENRRRIAELEVFGKSIPPIGSAKKPEATRRGAKKLADLLEPQTVTSDVADAYVLTAPKTFRL